MEIALTTQLSDIESESDDVLLQDLEEEPVIKFCHLGITGEVAMKDFVDKEESSHNNCVRNDRRGEWDQKVPHVRVGNEVGSCYIQKRQRRKQGNVVSKRDDQTIHLRKWENFVCL